jgi:hypothetical protein
MPRDEERGSVGGMAQDPTRHGSADGRRASPLSPSFAFVIQLREGADAGARFAGRVEHVQSANAARFESVPELLAFVAQVLRDLRKKSAERTTRRQDGGGFP